MLIKTAEFIKSSQQLSECPKPVLPEYAFFGRSNVGKSSLINMLADRKSLAKTSSTPGKTQLINHFLINDRWYLTDLPGFGYAKASKSNRNKWENMIRNYLLKKENLVCLFFLVDIRHKPLKNDLEYLNWFGKNQIPFAIVFTKSDKLNSSNIKANFEIYKKKLSETWDPLPALFLTSSEKKKGKEEILDFINNYNQDFISPEKSTLV
ncbi:MAG: ribosome biogenesis GTP-binding protein YihA/YsxC [Bacteroidales bacterium]